MAKFGPPGMEAWGVGEIRSGFPSTANIAMTFEWGGIPGMCEDKAIAAPAVIGDCGSAPRPGSMEVWDRENQKWVKLDKPNTAPLLNFGGWVGAITKTSKNQACAYDFLKFLNSPEISGKLVNWYTGKLVDWETGKPIYRFTNLPVYQSTWTLSAPTWRTRT